MSKAGFITEPMEDGLLPVRWQGERLCRLTAGGGAQFYKEDLEPDGRSEAFHHLTAITGEVAEYMQLMERAPMLIATGLDGDYRILGDFRNAVLAGYPTSQGIQFITWDWSHDCTGVGLEHYYEQNCARAKQDFAIRSV